MKNVRLFNILFSLVVCCLLFLLAACGSTPAAANHPGGGNGTVVTQKQSTAPSGTNQGQATSGSGSTNTPASPTPGNVNTGITTVPMPPTQTSCPADGSARAAVMRTLALGKDPSLVYIYNDVPQNTTIAYGILKRYDVTTGQKKEIVTSGLAIENAQVSADGQWVLFTSQIDPRGDKNHSMALQLVRMDGSGLQTLYCAPANMQISEVQWSVDQKSILLETVNPAANGITISLIDVATGNLHTELQFATPPDAFKLITWLDNTRAYIVRDNEAPTTMQPGLYLLDITKNKDVHGGDLKRVTDFSVGGTTVPSGNSADSSYDAKTLFVSGCQPNWSSTITSQAATGGKQQMIYNNLSGCINTLRAISSTKLLFVTQVLGGDFGKQVVMKARIDGSGSVSLYDNGGSHTVVELNKYSQFPWSNVSRDGSMYAFDQRGVMGNGIGLMFASLSGGKATEFASTLSGSVAVVGWTTM